MDKRTRVVLFERYGYFIPLPESFNFRGVFLTSPRADVKDLPWLKANPIIEISGDEARIQLFFSDGNLIINEEVLLWKEQNRVFVSNGQRLKDDLFSFIISDGHGHEIEVQIDRRAKVQDVFKEPFPARGSN